ncbi:MAG: methylmalonyl-CoA mutase [Flavobacteriales bacterium]|jgi:methylmalonyl-CoA mutase
MTDFADRNEMPSRADWDAAVTRDLKGRDFDRVLLSKLREGFSVAPLYTAADTALDAHLSRSSEQWSVVQRVNAPDVETCRQHIAEDVAQGCDGVHLRLDDAARLASSEPTLAGSHGAAIATAYELTHTLGDISLSSATVYLDAGANGLGAWGLWRSVASRARVPLHELRGGLLHDVSEAMLLDGELPASVSTLWDDAAALAADCAASAPGVRALAVSSAHAHESGADASLELGVLAASLVTTLRELQSRGIPAEQAAQQIICRVAVSTDMFLEIAKIRAARWILDRVVTTCGGQAGSLIIHATGSERSLARLDEPVNMLRGSTQALAAVAGGADVITTLPHDAASAGHSRLARRVARNAQLILRDETNAHVVRDPGAGSWTIEHLTQELATRGWATMQEMERRGGLHACVHDNWLGERVDSSWAQRDRDLRTAKSALVGVSAFPPADAVVADVAPKRDALNRALAKRQEHASGDLAQSLARVGAAPADREHAFAAYSAGASLAAVHAAQGRTRARGASALPRRRDSATFEELRSGDNHPALLVLAAAEGAVSARASWTRNLLQAGGFQLSAAEDASHGESVPAALHNTLAVLCLADSDFAEHLAPLVAMLSERGATVAVAGHPKNAPPVDGVALWLHVGIDIPEALQTLRSAVEAS